MFARGRLQGSQPPVVSADEHNAAGRSHGAAIAGILPGLPPNETIGLHIQRRENARSLQGGSAECTSQVLFSLPRGRLMLLAASEQARAVAGADVEVVGGGIVRTGRPIRTAPGGRFGHDAIDPERSENASMVHQGKVFVRDVHKLRNKSVAVRKRLSGGGSLT